MHGLLNVEFYPETRGWGIELTTGDQLPIFGWFIDARNCKSVPAVMVGGKLRAVKAFNHLAAPLPRGVETLDTPSVIAYFDQQDQQEAEVQARVKAAIALDKSVIAATGRGRSS